MPSPSFPFPLLFLLLFVVFLPSSSSTHSFHHDAQSLLAFKKGITSDPNNSMAAWTPALPFCNWTAVTCGRRHPNRVVALDLSYMDLRGTISASLGNLSFLRSLNLSNNMLYGPIPPQLGALFRLRWLWLFSNQLKGNIPPQLGALFRVRWLMLFSNQLHGNIPHQLSGCRHLVWLSLSFNNLSGNIPGELGSLPHLQQLHLGANCLTEYGLSEIVSTKGDVYSYGILLLEMFTRKRPTCDLFISDLSLHKWVSLAFPNKVKEVIDHNLFRELDEGEFEENNFYKSLLCLLRVGLLCSKDSPDERPTMRDVVTVLENLKDDLVGNTIAFSRLGQSISNLLGNTNTAGEGAPISNDQSSSTF